MNVLSNVSQYPRVHLQLIALIEDAKVFTELSCINAEQGQVDAGAACRYMRAAIVFCTMATEAFLNFTLSVHTDGTRPKQSDSFRAKLRWLLSTLPGISEKRHEKAFDDLVDRICKTYALRNHIVHYRGEIEVEETPLYLQGDLKPENIVKGFVALRTILQLAYPDIAFDDPTMRSILRLHRYEKAD